LQYQLSKLLFLVLVAFPCRENISRQRVGWSYSEAVCRLITARQEAASPSLISVVIRTDVARKKAQGKPLLSSQNQVKHVVTNSQPARSALYST